MLLVLQIVISIMGVYLIYVLRKNAALRAGPARAQLEAAGLLAKELKDTCAAMAESLERRRESLAGLVEEADTRIRLLGQLSARAAADGGTDNGYSIEDRYNQVFALYDRGLSLSEIAKQTSMDKGQVQLIFNLKRKL